MLFDLALLVTDPPQSRWKELQYITSKRPELASKICYVKNDSGEEIPVLVFKSDFAEVWREIFRQDTEICRHLFQMNKTFTID